MAVIPLINRFMSNLVYLLPEMLACRIALTGLHKIGN